MKKKGDSPLFSLLDDVAEWHALVIGLCEILCPVPPRHQPSEELLHQLSEEHHYYMAGRAVATLLWLAFSAIMVAMLR